MAAEPPPHQAKLTQLTRPNVSLNRVNFWRSSPVSTQTTRRPPLRREPVHPTCRPLVLSSRYSASVLASTLMYSIYIVVRRALWWLIVVIRDKRSLLARCRQQGAELSMHVASAGGSIATRMFCLGDADLQFLSFAGLCVGHFYLPPSRALPRPSCRDAPPCPPSVPQGNHRRGNSQTACKEHFVS